MSTKISKEEFVFRAIKNLRTPPYKGIHVRYSGFNLRFKEYFEEEARPTVDRMVEEGKIEKRLVKGGPVIYLAGEKPRSENTLAKILGEDA